MILAVGLSLVASPGALAQGRFPEGRAVDRPTASVAEVIGQLDGARNEIVQAATHSADPLIWSTAQRVSLLVSSLSALHDPPAKESFNRLPAQEQQIIRDTYLLIDLADSVLAGTVSDSSLLEKRLTDSARLIASLDENAPAVFQVTPLAIAGAPADSPVSLEITGNKLFFTEKPPMVSVGDAKIGPAPISNNDKLVFEIPRSLAFPETGIGAGQIGLTLYQKKKRGMFRTEIIPIDIQLPVFLFPSRLASYVVTANVEVESEDTKTRRSVELKVESTGGPVSDEVCVNARAGSEIIATSAKIGKAVDEEWVLDTVLDIWDVSNQTANKFEKNVTAKRACLTVTAQPTQPGHRAVASGWIEFQERTATTKRASEELQGDLLWGENEVLALPESTTAVEIAVTFYDGTTETFAGSGDHRWMSVEFDSATRTLTMTGKAPESVIRNE